MSLINFVSEHVYIPPEVHEGLQHLIDLIDSEKGCRKRKPIRVRRTTGKHGCPKLCVSREHLQELIALDMTIPCISKILGLSVKTVKRRMEEWGLRIKESYSSLTDDELDKLVSEIKQESKNMGIRAVRAHLRAQGHKLQQTRVLGSMRRVDRDGMVARNVSVRESRIISAPLLLLEIDTNRKLMRYGVVLFTGMDAFSRKILYLRAVNNNKPSTALKVFLDAADKHGFPSRVKGPQAAENLDIARCMFTARGCKRRSFISEKSANNPKTEQLWCEVSSKVLDDYSRVLNSLEGDGLLDPRSSTHLFCAQYVFLPRVQAELDTLTEEWNNHPHQTEHSCTPNQLWEAGKPPRPDTPPCSTEGRPWSDMITLARSCSEGEVPDVPSPLDNEEMETLASIFSPVAPSLCYGADVYCAVVQYVEGVVSSNQESNDGCDKIPLQTCDSLSSSITVGVD
ncbi:uncharacterized protein LOC114860437 isoform X2 [Betta splendens]|nr:uncharacterized protein LOC114860437 isoform X2 [Betta splendens]XP_029014864.1 uncharacterized protein LOC114860437 isoform X2 [Betta splendens]XP_055366844.1 uncharacterized protein LOC114860437 isoform X2 [Betta splendens]